MTRGVMSLSLPGNTSSVSLARIVSLISAIVGFLTANGNSFMEALFPLSRTGSVLCETFHSE